MCGEGDDGQMTAALAFLLADDRCCLPPIHVGHLHVHEY
jgi:hypothetical protein